MRKFHRKQRIQKCDATTWVEKRVAAPEALLHEILNAIPDLIFFKDPEGKYRLCNTAFCNYVGLAEEDIFGKNDRELFAGLSDDPNYYSDMDRCAIETGKARSNEEEITYPDGSKRTLETIKTPCYTTSGEFIGLFGTSRDITERKRSEERLHIARRDALQASQAKSEFLANMSHEIRTPMNGILGLCYLACRKECSPELHEYLVKIESSAQRLMSVLNDILDFSKIEAGRLSIEYTQMRIRDVAAYVQTLLRAEAEVKHLDLCCTVDPALPEILWGDPLRVQQILLNLGGNALKFTSTGGVAISLSLLLLEGGKAHVELAVEDSGIGIAHDALPHLFQPFSQADTSTTRKYGGTGLGLAICKNFSSLMGGNIAVESELGRGATFCVTLPLLLSDTESVELDAGVLDSSRQSASVGPLDALQNAHILMAEDNAINQFIIQEILNAKGVRLDIVSNGCEAVARAAEDVYDAILMDIQMPEMGGIESTQLLRRMPALDGTPIIALSACALPEEQEESLAAGMQAHVTKPVDPPRLCATLAYWIEKYRKKG